MSDKTCMGTLSACITRAKAATRRNLEPSSPWLPTFSWQLTQSHCSWLSKTAPDKTRSFRVKRSTDSTMNLSNLLRMTSKSRCLWSLPCLPRLQAWKPNSARISDARPCWIWLAAAMTRWLRIENIGRQELARRCTVVLRDSFSASVTQECRSKVMAQRPTTSKKLLSSWCRVKN